MANSFFTVGHSTRTIHAFASLLKEANAQFVVDVRTIPRSRANPQYDRDVLPGSLAAHAIGYEHVASLGGLRGRQRDIPPTINAFWSNESFHNYADYAMGDEFHLGVTRLRELGKERRPAIMCAESVWWRCHRRIIADYLILAGEEVWHIIGPGRIVRAQLTPAARSGPRATLVYPENAPPRVSLRLPGTSL
jgi:uncharacterized protein (DUF488 family)